VKDVGNVPNQESLASFEKNDLKVAIRRRSRREMWGRLISRALLARARRSRL
jgi:hypothetical protein